MKTPGAIPAAKIPSSLLNHLTYLTFLHFLLPGLPGQLLALDLDPVLRGSWPSVPRGAAQAVAIQNDYAFVAVGNAGLAIIDVSNPANPQPLGGYDTSDSAMGVALSGNYAYVADGTNGLEVIDVSNPANPQWVGGCNTSGSASGVAVAGNYAYVAGTIIACRMGWCQPVRGELLVIDISNPAPSASSSTAKQVSASASNAVPTCGTGRTGNRLLSVPLPPSLPTPMSVPFPTASIARSIPEVVGKLNSQTSFTAP